MLKKFLIGTFAIVALAFAMSASAAYDFGTVTLKVGSKGPAVVAVQTLVGAVADGSFGPMTKAKVMAWQATNGLVADGVFGPASKAKANGAVVVTPSEGCEGGALFNSKTGASCSATVTLPAGCTSTAGFSSTTGAKCDGGSTTVQGPLVGGAGDITLSPTSTDVEESIIEGQSNTKVLGFKVEASDSDVALKNLKVTFVHGGTGSTRLDKYVSNVSVWMGSTKIGTVEAADFTKDVNTYSKSITLTDAIVREGISKKATFYITVDAVPTIDSMNQDGHWDITVDNVRFQDATGVIMTSGSQEVVKEGVTIKTLANSGDVKLVVSKGTSTPVEGNVEVSDTSSTADVLMLEFKLKDTGSDMTFDTVTVNLTGSLADADLSNMLGELTLKEGSTELATTSTYDSQSLPTTAVFNLDSTYELSADSTSTFRVYAKINSTDNFTNGDYLKVSLPSYANDGINTEDANGDPVEYTGTANGEFQHFYSEGISASNFVSGTPTVTTNTAGQTISASFPITFKVTAFGNDFYIPKAGTSLINTGATGIADLSATNATDENTAWLISNGDTATFTTTAVVAGGVGISGFKNVQLDTLHYGLDTGSMTTHYDFTPASNFKTTSVFFTAVSA